MKLSVNIKNKMSYNIIIENNLQLFISDYLNIMNKGQKWILCYPKNLAIDSEILYNHLRLLKYDISKVEIDDGESIKDIDKIKPIISQLHSIGCRRDSILIALGGGTIGDYIGFIASIYMRGIRYINIPTTLLSMVDASVGGKTGINTKNGKNTIGSFYEAKYVIIDPKFLKTLDNFLILSFEKKCTIKPSFS